METKPSERRTNLAPTSESKERKNERNGRTNAKEQDELAARALCEIIERRNVIKCNENALAMRRTGGRATQKRIKERIVCCVSCNIGFRNVRGVRRIFSLRSPTIDVICWPFALLFSSLARRIFARSASAPPALRLGPRSAPFERARASRSPRSLRSPSGDSRRFFFSLILFERKIKSLLYLYDFRHFFASIYAFHILLRASFPLALLRSGESPLSDPRGK